VATTYKVQAQFPATTAVTSNKYISNKALTSNLATLTTNAVHGISQVGTIVIVQGVDSTFDGTYTIHSIPTTTTFTFVKTNANVTSAAVSPVGIATFLPVTSGFTVSNKVIQNTVCTLTSSSAHGLSVGDYIAVTIGDTNVDTQQAQVIGIPSSTLFSFVSTTTTLATAAVSQGSWCKTTFQSSYTVPASTQGVSSTVYITNTSKSTQYYRLSAQKGGAALANQFIAFDAPIATNSTVALTTGLALNAAEIVTMQASSNQVIFTIDGSELT
jgi:hypothetical protein